VKNTPSQNGQNNDRGLRKTVRPNGLNHRFSPSSVLHVCSWCVFPSLRVAGSCCRRFFRFGCAEVVSFGDNEDQFYTFRACQGSSAVCEEACQTWHFEMAGHVQGGQRGWHCPMLGHFNRNEKTAAPFHYASRQHDKATVLRCAAAIACKTCRLHAVPLRGGLAHLRGPTACGRKNVPCVVRRHQGTYFAEAYGRESFDSCRYS